MNSQNQTSIKMIFREFWRGILPHKRMFWICLAAFLTIQLVQLAVPLFYKNFFDAFGQTGTSAQDLIKIIAIIAIINFVNWNIHNIAFFSLSAIIAKIMAKLKQNAFNYLMLHSRNFFVNNFAGGLTQKVNRFARSFEILIDTLVFDLIPIAVTIIGTIAITAFIAPIISIIIAAWTILAIAGNFIFSRWKVKFDIAAAAADSKTTSMLSDNIINYVAVKLFGGYGRESKNFQKISDEQAKKTLTTWQLSNISNAFQHLLIFIVEFAVFYYTIRLWQNGQAFIGTFVLVQIYIIGIVNNLWGLSRMFRGIYQGLADSKEMVEIMAMPHEIKDIAGAKDLGKARGEIEFKNVRFAFKNGRDILKNFNAKIPAGQKIAIVGRSGAGKTTLSGLLLRLFDPLEGEILVDGKNIKYAALESLRENISLVPQDPLLFHRTIMENIRYGRPEATDNEVIAAAIAARCDRFIEKMPAKYETLVGERGVKLSGGERQRVAIARAILKNAPILILDEATSSLDSQSEKLIQDALEILMEGRTTIAIAHRLSTIRKMDRVIVVKNGIVAEDGPHQSLIRKKDGIYRKFWRLQSSGFIE